MVLKQRTVLVVPSFCAIFSTFREDLRLIDWLSLTLPYKGPDLNGGHLVSLRPGGEIHYHVDKYLDVEGSFSDKVKCRAFSGKLWLSGNPSKFLQGHNHFGLDDFHTLSAAFVRSVLGRVPEIADKNLYDTEMALDAGLYNVNRIDLTQMFHVGSRTDAKQWLSASRRYLSTNNQSIDLSENTWYIGKHSRRLTIKGYYKPDEVEKHKQTTGNIALDKALQGWSSGKVRIEITLRRKYLEDKIFCHGLVKDTGENRSFSCRKMSLEKACAWNDEVSRGVYAAIMKEKVFMPTDAEKLDTKIEKLPRSARATFYTYKHGVDVREMLPRRTFYNHRKIIRDIIGVDIGRSISNTAFESNVIPLMRVLEATPAQIPEWAYEYGLVVGS